jgi:O-antigen/teichoic acid export membrane protein
LIAIGLSLILATVGWFVSPLINDGPTIVWELRRVFLAMPLYIVPGIWVGSLQAARISWWNVARLIQPAIYVPYIVVLQFTGELTLRTAVDAFLISLIVQNIGTGLMAYKLLGFRRARKEQAWALWQYGIRSVTSNLPTFVNSRFDQLLLSVSVSTAALGNYALAVSLSSLAMPAASAFGSVAFPKMAGAAAQDQPEVRRRALIGGIITASAFAIPIAILGPFLIPRAFGPGYDRAITCLLILAPAAVVLVANQINEDLLRGEGRPLIPTAAELFGSLITIVFLLLLVPIIGILGAALASLVSYVAVAFALWYLRQRRKTLPISNEGVDEVTP